MPEPLAIAVNCGPIDEQGKRLVVTCYGKRSHNDRFDVDASFQRQKWREAVIKTLKLRGPWNPNGSDDNEVVHAELESKLHAAVEAGDETDSAPLVTANVVSLAEVHAKPIRWFWDSYMPAGALTLLDGDPNEGKSQIAISIAARYSIGQAMPNCLAGGCRPGNVLLMSAEDDLERTTVPRLVAQDADMRRIHHLRTVTPFGSEGERPVQLPCDVPAIEAIVVEKQIGFIVLDVFTAFIQEGYNPNGDSDMRRLLSPLSAMAERTQAAILMLRHMNKKEGTRSMYRGGGSVAIVGAARAAFAVAPHPEDPTQKVFAAIKHNLGPRPHSLTYSIEPAATVSRIVWGVQTDLLAADVLKGETPRQGGKKADQAKDIIADVLAQGPRGSNEVLNACLSAGLSERTYWGARKALGIRAEKTDFAGNWLLTMPANGSSDHDF